MDTYDTLYREEISRSMEDLKHRNAENLIRKPTIAEKRL